MSGADTPRTGPLLSMRGIARTFHVPDSPPLHILTGIDLDVSAGEHLAIVGRSGTGKSTLLNLLGLIDVPTAGHYEVDGIPTDRLGEARRALLRGRTFSYVFQSFNLIPGLSTTENVAAPLLYDTGKAFWTRMKRAEELLEAVGLGNRIGSSIERLSGGEQQRVAIARALARRPRVILADEPTGALDVDTGALVMDLLERQCHENGAALVIITHDLAVASRAQSAYRLGDGVLTPIEVERREAGSLEQFSEAAAAGAGAVGPGLGAVEPGGQAPPGPDRAPSSQGLDPPRRRSHDPRSHRLPRGDHRGLGAAAHREGPRHALPRGRGGGRRRHDLRHRARAGRRGRHQQADRGQHRPSRHGRHRDQPHRARPSPRPWAPTRRAPRRHPVPLVPQAPRPTAARRATPLAGRGRPPGPARPAVRAGPGRGPPRARRPAAIPPGARRSPSASGLPPPRAPSSSATA